MHEQSETVKREDGKWINVYGRNTPQAGQQLPGTAVHDTVESAVDEARKRSESFDEHGHAASKDLKAPRKEEE